MKIKNTSGAVVIVILFALIGSCKCKKKTQTIPPPPVVDQYQPAFSFKTSYEKKKRNGFSLKELMERNINNGVHSSELMLMSTNLAAFLSMYELTDSISYLQKAFDFSKRVVASAKVSSEIKGNKSPFKDQYLTWINLNPTFEETKRGSPHMREFPLYESYFFRYMAKMLYLSSKMKAKDKSQFRKDYNYLLDFIVTNGWQKWYVRGKSIDDCNAFIFRSRTHMACQWGVVALYLSELDGNKIRMPQYSKFLNSLNNQLRDNLKLDKNKAYVWNMTWDSDWPLGTNCNKTIKPIIQDGSHGNHVINYVVSAYELDRYWDSNDIDKFVRTVNLVLYDRSKQLFYADLNGKYEKSYAGGLRFGDGFLKLARYNNQLLTNFENARKAQQANYHFRYGECQYVAEYLLARKYQSN